MHCTCIHQDRLKGQWGEHGYAHGKVHDQLITGTIHPGFGPTYFSESAQRTVCVRVTDFPSDAGRTGSVVIITSSWQNTEGKEREQ